jgi:hypothetical protein
MWRRESKEEEMRGTRRSDKSLAFQRKQQAPGLKKKIYFLYIFLPEAPCTQASNCGTTVLSSRFVQ